MPVSLGGSLQVTVGASYIEASRTAGDLSLTSTAIADIDTGLDLVLPAVAGDVIEYGISGLLDVAAQEVAFEVFTVVAGAPVNSFGPGLASPKLGVSGWYAGTDGAYHDVTGSTSRTLVAGDISAGTVTMRLRYVKASATARTLYANANIPLKVWAKNLRVSGVVGGAGMLAKTVYSPTADTTIATTTSTSLVDADATNLAVTFTAPASGEVSVTLECLGETATNAQAIYWGLREATTNLTFVGGGTKYFMDGGPQARRMRATFFISGLVSGSSHTYKWAIGVSGANTANLHAGDVSYGPAVMIVHDQNVGGSGSSSASTNLYLAANYT